MEIIIHCEFLLIQLEFQAWFTSYLQYKSRIITSFVAFRITEITIRKICKLLSRKSSNKYRKAQARR